MENFSKTLAPGPVSLSEVRSGKWEITGNPPLICGVIPEEVESDRPGQRIATPGL